MALVEDESLPHGPLELLMTVAEEVGLEGANALDGSLLTGSILINLDSEEDGTSHRRVRREHRHLDQGRGAAGAGSRRCGRRCRSRPVRDSAATRASGSRLGHANAIKVLGRVLREAHDERAVPARLARPAARAATRSPATRQRSAPFARDQERRSATAWSRRPRYDARRVREDRPGSDRRRSRAPETPPTPGRKRERRRCSMSSRSYQRDRSR